MSERILKALMQLFAIIARVDDEEAGETDHAGGGRRIVELFLKQQLPLELVEEYLQKFDEFLNAHQGNSAKKDGQRKRTSVNSVKVLKICTQINEELAQKQKLIVLVRIIEFINENHTVTEQEIEFASTVADTFNISKEEYDRVTAFANTKEVDNGRIDDDHWLDINSTKENTLKHTKHIYSEGIQGRITVLSVKSVGIYLLRYFGQSELLLNGQAINPGGIYVLTQGSSLRSSRVAPIYYSDIIARFLSDKSDKRIVFKADNIVYHFKGGKLGLHPFTFSEESGKLLGIMGGSGAGKSTLLNILNGNYKPTQGSVTINGVNIHTESNKIEGVIGYVSQDDLLIEELTVFQNLYYNAKLCFGSMGDAEITKRVSDVLKAIGLFEAKDLRVGSPLDKTISGGQRKRLNIALELIREPAVMFVDEPTSGLSSRDSENIMDLLKELSLKGKLIFVVIHQPSSEIFKMFDKLMILDVGGLPIYYGNPVDAVVYFKLCVNHVNAHESECPECGNVNPEQIFNIIESKVVDEYGNLTTSRKISAKQWNDSYKEQIAPKMQLAADEKEKPESTFKIPNKLKQFKVYFIRDVLSKLTNTQYILINLLEAPLLALILGFFVKFFQTGGLTSEYVYRESENVPQFLFISVVVALFIGLTVAAEEIIKDQKILKRESFLNLSKSSYLLSKISIMFTISAIQMLLYIAVGNYVLGIKGMFFYHWFILFSTTCFANMLGLNISASFNSAKVIYILIPILIIPQLLFSGVIVKFDKLHPLFASQSSVPLLGNVMASRWAYEAMAVTQFKNNEFEKLFYPLEKNKSFSKWKKDYWIKDLETKVQDIRRGQSDKAQAKMIEHDLEILRNEIKSEMNFVHGVGMKGVDQLTPNAVNENVLKEAEKYLGILKQHYRNVFNENEKLKDKLVQKMQKDSVDKNGKVIVDGAAAYELLRNSYTNESLDNFVTNYTEFDYTVEENGKLVQKKELIFRDPYDKGFFDAHFYAPRKKFFGTYIDTFWANAMVIWFMTLLLSITLYFDALKRLLDGFGKIKLPKMKKSKK
jgi:ABC-type multidrug transport system ATPase subunit